MVSKVDEFKVYCFSFDKEELIEIVDALRAYQSNKLADGICDEMGWGDEHEGINYESNIASLIFDVDTSALEAATVKLNDLADAAERAANEVERLEGALK